VWSILLGASSSARLNPSPSSKTNWTDPQSRYGFGLRLRPPRGRTYINTIRATMTTAAMATMATVDAATITPRSSPGTCERKPVVVDVVPSMRRTRPPFVGLLQVEGAA